MTGPHIPGPAGPATILVVDDDPDCRTLACEAFRAACPACRALPVTGPFEAIDFLHRHGRFRRAPRPDLICMDMEMPDLSGLELLRLVKAAPDLRDIPVILFTGVDDETLRRLSLEAGAGAYAVKPSDPARFPAVLAEALARCPGAPAPLEGHAA